MCLNNYQQLLSKLQSTDAVDLDNYNASLPSGMPEQEIRSLLPIIADILIELNKQKREVAMTLQDLHYNQSAINKYNQHMGSNARWI